MRNISLQRSDSVVETEISTPAAPTYGMTLTVTSANDMPLEVFVKQRLAADGSRDNFAAIATPEQLEDLLVDEPHGSTSYFRTSSVVLYSLNKATLDDLYSTIVEEIQLLVANLDALDRLENPPTNCVITANSLTYS